jgi:Leucine Rich repeat
MEINESALERTHRRRPRFRLSILLTLTGLLLAVVFFSQLSPSVVKKLGPAAEAVYDLFNAPTTEPLSLSGQRVVADVNALGGHALVSERTPGLFGLLGRKELFSVNFSGIAGGKNGAFGDRELARLVKSHGDRIWGLYLLDTNVTDLGLLVLRDLPNVRHISLEYSDPKTTPTGLPAPTQFITDAGLVNVGSLTTIQSLHLRGLPITDTGLEALAGLTAVHVLYLDRTQVRGPGLAHLSSIRQLMDLNLSGSAVTDQGLSYLSGSKIYQLSLDGVPLSGESLKALKLMPSLQYLEIRGCGLSDEAVNDLKTSKPMLQVVR